MTGWKKDKNHQRRRDASRQPSHRFDSIRSIPECVSKRRELREQSSVNAMTGLFRAIIRDTARKFITERYCPPDKDSKCASRLIPDYTECQKMSAFSLYVCEYGRVHCRLNTIYRFASIPRLIVTFIRIFPQSFVLTG